MTSKLNPRWLAAALIWAGAIFASYLNYAQIQEIAFIRGKNDRLRQEMLFQHRNAARLDRIQSIQASYSLPVASAKLGFESVRSRLHGLSAKLGFQDIKIEGRMEQATENRMPFRLKMQGTYDKAANYIATLQSIPYLVLKSSRIVVATPKSAAEIELNFDLQFTIDPVQGLETSPLQAAADPLKHKAVAR
jgi:Tfp pilus assembly protein PilO